MTTPEDPRIWQGIRSHLHELGSVATVPPIRGVLERPRSSRMVRAVAGVAGAGALMVAVGLLLPGLLVVSAPMTGAAPTSSSPPATADALQTAVPVDVAGLIGHTFVATDVTENGQSIAIVADTRIVISFGDAMHFGASGGCNPIGGDYEIRDGRLMTANLRLTLKGCLGKRGQQEGMFITFLQSSPAISGDTMGLVLSSGAVVITFVDEATT